MSLDLTISTSCKKCGRGDEESFNYTYNVSSMWYDVFPEDEGMVGIDGLTGKKAAKKINKAITKLLKWNVKKINKHNPPNGWGDYKGFIEFLSELSDACVRHPNGVWRAWR